MKKTSNYALSQWEKTDRIQMEDFNSDNAAVDAALKTLSDTLSTGLALRGNCQLYAAAYTGDGTHSESNPRSMVFPHQPMAIFVANTQRKFWAIRGMTSTQGITSGESYTLRWDGNKVFWNGYGSGGVYHLDQAGVTYYVLALLDMEN